MGLNNDDNNNEDNNNGKNVNGNNSMKMVNSILYSSSNENENNGINKI